MLQIALVHLPVADGNFRLGDQIAEQFRHRVNRIDAIMQIKHLPAAINFVENRLFDQLCLVSTNDGLNRQTFPRRRFNDAQITRPHERHVKRARNRRRAHRQHIDIRTQALDFLLLLHAETMFLVNDEQAEFFKFHGGAEQGVRPDDNVQIAACKLVANLAALRRRTEAGKHFHGNRIMGKAVAKRIEMLLREHGRRRQNGDLASAQNGLECGTDGDFGFPESDVSANQAVHRRRAFHVLLGVVNCASLIGRFGKRKGFFEFAQPR